MSCYFTKEDCDYLHELLGHWYVISHGINASLDPALINQRISFIRVTRSTGSYEFSYLYTTTPLHLEKIFDRQVLLREIAQSAKDQYNAWMGE